MQDQSLLTLTLATRDWRTIEDALWQLADDDDDDDPCYLLARMLGHYLVPVSGR